LDAQEQVGIDVIGDGELGRWDLDRREPAGMVERFVRPMQGVQTGLTRKQRESFLADPTTAYRAAAHGVVVGDVSDGDLDLLREYQQARSLTDRPLKFTLTSPYMLAKVVADDYYHDLEQLTMAIADVLARQVHGIDADVIQIDVKDIQVESPEVVADRIEAHAKSFGAERLAYVHPDCGLQVLPRAVADGKLAALVKGRDLFLGHRR
jgi:5-methyltetrahydropteroyltriglutamate--homocysteine methyltransferase